MIRLIDLGGRWTAKVSTERTGQQRATLVLIDQGDDNTDAGAIVASITEVGARELVAALREAFPSLTLKAVP